MKTKQKAKENETITKLKFNFMPTKNRMINALIVGNFNEVFSNIKIRQSSTFRFKDGKMCYLQGDKSISAEEFEKQHPIAFKPKRTKGASIDTTKFD